jgi:hypothetical protein
MIAPAAFLVAVYASLADAPSFRNDILPILSHAGCSTGACHGSARGQDGFHLSLFGFDAVGDERAVLRELPGRRVNLSEPERSLLYTKAIGAVPHTGGERFKADDPRAKTLLGWLKAGAPADPPDLPRLVGVEVSPTAITLALDGNQLGAVQVTARYSDGSTRDVTSVTTLFSTNDFAASVAPNGSVRPAHPGEAEVIARYGAFVVGSSVLVTASTPATPAAATSPNRVDRAIDAKLARMGVQASERSTDGEFLRRVTLDLNGRLPTNEEFDRFMADAAAEKRLRVIDDLMSRKEFAEIWVMKWAERLGIRSTLEVSPKAALLYANWLRSRFAAGAPIDAIVREIVAAEGGTFDAPATNFYQLERDTLKLSENVAQAFLGTRLQCAQCHNHPFDRWTMDDYYGFAAFFTQVARKPAADPRETVIFNGGGGEVNHPVGGAPVKPKLLGGDVPDCAGRDRRAVLAEWLTSPSNGMFARNVANFVFAHFFHRGIVEPVDDVRATNPPSNRELIEELAAILIESKYDVRPLVREICASEAYQRSTRTNATNETDERNFSHAVVRRIRAEFLLDSISQVTETRDKFDGLPLGSRAVQIADGSTSSYFLTTFGRAKRATVCTCEVSMEPSLSQALHLVNGETVHEKIKQGGRVARELAAGGTPEEILTRLYVACLSRTPSKEEVAALLAQPEGTPPVEPRVLLEDAFWALLNSREFVFNH